MVLCIQELNCYNFPLSQLYSFLFSFCLLVWLCFSENWTWRKPGHAKKRGRNSRYSEQFLMKWFYFEKLLSQWVSVKKVDNPTGCGFFLTIEIAYRIWQINLNKKDLRKWYSCYISKYSLWFNTKSDIGLV